MASFPFGRGERRSLEEGTLPTQIAVGALISLGRWKLDVERWTLFLRSPPRRAVSAVAIWSLQASLGTPFPKKKWTKGVRSLTSAAPNYAKIHRASQDEEICLQAVESDRHGEDHAS